MVIPIKKSRSSMELLLLTLTIKPKIYEKKP